MSEPDGRSPVTWRLDSRTSRALRAAAFVGVAPLAGFFVVSLGAMALLAISAAQRGEYAIPTLVALLVLVGGPVSLLYLWPALGSRERRRAFPNPFGDEKSDGSAGWLVGGLTPRQLAMALVTGTAAVLAVSRLAPGAFSWLLAGWIVVVLLASVVSSRGRIDPVEGTMTYWERSVPLDRVARYRRLPFGSLVAYHVTYVRGERRFTTPSLLVLPGDVARIFERTVEGTPRSEPGEPPNRRVRIALYATGGLFVCLAVAALWPLFGIDPFARRYLAAVFGFLGLLFLSVGRASA